MAFTEYVDSGEIVNDEVVENGTQYILGGGLANSGTVTMGGTQVIEENGHATDMTLTGTNMVGQQGIQWVYGGGLAEGTLVQLGGNLIVDDNASATDITLVLGGRISASTSVLQLTGADLATGIVFSVQNGTANNFVVDGNSTFTVNKTHSALDTLVRFGKLDVLTGGTAVDTVVSGEESFILISNGAESLQTVLKNGATEQIAQGGVSKKAQIQEGCIQQVSGLAQDATVIGRMDVERNGAISGTTTVSGLMNIKNGSKTAIGGVLVVSGGKIVTDKTVTTQSGLDLRLEGKANLSLADFALVAGVITVTNNGNVAGALALDADSKIIVAANAAANGLKVTTLVNNGTITATGSQNVVALGSDAGMNITVGGFISAYFADLNSVGEAYAIRSGSYDASGVLVAAATGQDQIDLQDGAEIYGTISLTGGNNSFTAGAANINGNVYVGGGSVGLTGTTLFGNFYGGGARELSESVTILATTVTAFNFIGGGRFGSIVSTNLTMGGNSKINYFFGGGLGGSVKADVTIEVSGGSYWRFYAGSGNSGVGGNVTLTITGGNFNNVIYGAGSGNVSGNVIVTIDSGADLSSGVNLYGGNLSGYTGALTTDGVQGSGMGYAVGGNISLALTGVTNMLGIITGGNFNTASGSDAVHSSVGGKISIALSGVTQTPGNYAWVFGGSFARNNAVDVVTGGVDLAISGASNLGYVVGGGRAENGASATVANDVSIQISGGTFNRTIFGGGFANGKNSNANIDGNVTISVNVGSQGVSILDGIYLGGYAYGAGASATVKGKREIVFSGDGGKLSFAGSLNGGDKAIQGATGTTATSAALVFRSFSGSFTAAIYDFSSLVVSGASNVTLTKAQTENTFSQFTFDLTGRTSESSALAMLTFAKEYKVFGADATERNITVTSTELGGMTSGSYCLLKGSSDFIASLLDLDFSFNFDGQKTTLFADNVSWRTAGDFDWCLALDKTNGSLSLQWRDASIDIPGSSSLTLEDVTARQLAAVEVPELASWGENLVKTNGFLA